METYFCKKKKKMAQSQKINEIQHIYMLKERKGVSNSHGKRKGLTNTYSCKTALSKIGACGAEK